MNQQALLVVEVVGVATDVRAPVDDKNTLAELRRNALGNRQAEKTGTDEYAASPHTA